MKIMSNKRCKFVLLALMVQVGSAAAVERPLASLEQRVQDAEIVVVADAIAPQPFIGREFDKFYRVQIRVAGVLKGSVAVGDRLDVVVDHTIAEQRNDCCKAGHAYVLFLRQQERRYHFVGGPQGAVPVEFSPIR